MLKSKRSSGFCVIFLSPIKHTSGVFIPVLPVIFMLVCVMRPSHYQNSEKGFSSICKLIEQAGTHLFFSKSKCYSCRVVVFNGSTSVPALKSCAIDTDLGTTVGVVTRNGVTGADLRRAGVGLNEAS